MDKDFFKWLFKALKIDVNNTSKVFKKYTTKSGLENVIATQGLVKMVKLLSVLCVVSQK